MVEIANLHLEFDDSLGHYLLMNNIDSRFSKYDEHFYQYLGEYAKSSAQVILSLVNEVFTPKSVVDFGCGNGEWLTQAKQHFNAEIFAVDGKWNSDLPLIGCQYQYADLGIKLELPKTYEMAICLEVIEHISPDAGNLLIDSLCSASNVILFSGAIPHQPGTDHINCKWQYFWNDEFKTRGYHCVDFLRFKTWDNEQVAWWYKQNIFIYVKEGSTAFNSFKDVTVEKHWPLNLVHPELYSKLMTSNTLTIESLSSENNKLKNIIAKPPTLRFSVGVFWRYIKCLVRRN